MSRKGYLVLVLLVSISCVLLALFGVVGYLAYRAMSEPSGSVAIPQSQQSERGDTGLSQPQAGGALRLAGALPPTLDPALVQDSTSAEYVIHLFSGLVVLNADMEISPDLASRWEISPDGRTYTFTLRPDATFSDGRAIAAQDVVYALERACSPQLGSPVALSYLDDIVGVREFAEGRADHITGLAALSEGVLEIKIDAPKAYFLAKLTYPTAFVVDQVQIEQEGENWLRKPNGSGPFTLQSFDRERIVLVRNDRYYGQGPAVQQVEFILNGGVPITMYENDQLDIVDVPPWEIERVLDPENPLHAELQAAAELSVQYLGLNVDAPPFDDPAVRQAFAHAIDKAKLADLVLKGTATPARGILPPALPDYDGGVIELAYDPERARQLLASSRYAQSGSMPPIALAISGTSGQMPSLIRAILAMIEDNLGLQLTVEQVEWSDFLNDMNRRRYQIYSAGWIGDYPDSQNFLDILFHSASAQNHTGYRNPEVDALLEKARIESDPTRRTELYRQAERIILSDAPWIPLTHGLSYRLVKPYVQGYQPSPSLYPWLKDVAVQP